MFRRILVGYAGDRAGRDGVLLASRLSQLTGAPVSVAFPYHPLSATVPSAVAEQRVRGELSAMLPGDPLPSQARCHWSSSSWPIHALCELAAFEEADVIVFGAAPERLGRRHVELMERMVHGAPCAVAVAPDRYADSAPAAIRRVAAGFTDTAEGRAAVLTGSELARLAGQPLTVVSGSGPTGASAAYAAMSPALPEAEQEMYEEALGAARRIAGGIGERTRIDVRRGDPVRVLLDSTATMDLLVVGSRANGPVRHTLLGGVSAAVMRDASCPVLALPRQALRNDAVIGGDAALARRQRLPRSVIS